MKMSLIVRPVYFNFEDVKRLWRLTLYRLVIRFTMYERLANVILEDLFFLYLNTNLVLSSHCIETETE